MREPEIVIIHKRFLDSIKLLVKDSFKLKIIDFVRTGRTRDGIVLYFYRCDNFTLESIINRDIYKDFQDYWIDYRYLFKMDRSKLSYYNYLNRSSYVSYNSYTNLDFDETWIVRDIHLDFIK